MSSCLRARSPKGNETNDHGAHLSIRYTPAETKDLFDILGTTTILDPALMSAAPHYGLRYGFAPATGNFQRLRGPFTAVTRVQIPSGTPV
jgi:hypothetical protein